MRRLRERRALLPHGEHGLAEPVRPEPGRVDRLVLLPAARVVAPDLEAARVPVVAEQVRRALCPVELEPGPAVALDRLARDDRREGAVLVAEDDVGDVGIRIRRRRARRPRGRRARSSPPRAPRRPGRAGPSGSSGCRSPPRRGARRRSRGTRTPSASRRCRRGPRPVWMPADGPASKLAPERAEGWSQLHEGRGEEVEALAPRRARRAARPPPGRGRAASPRRRASRARARGASARRGSRAASGRRRRDASDSRTARASSTSRVRAGGRGGCPTSPGGERRRAPPAPARAPRGGRAPGGRPAGRCPRRRCRPRRAPSQDLAAEIGVERCVDEPHRLGHAVQLARRAVASAPYEGRLQTARPGGSGPSRPMRSTSRLSVSPERPRRSSKNERTASPEARRRLEELGVVRAAAPGTGSSRARSSRRRRSGPRA